MILILGQKNPIYLRVFNVILTLVIRSVMAICMGLIDQVKVLSRVVIRASKS